MSYLTRLKADISGKTAIVPTVKTAISPYPYPFYSFGSSDSEHISKNELAKAAASDALPALESIAENCSEFYEERAAIAEFDGGLSRDDAEAAARAATEKHRRECFERLEKAANAILSLPTRAMQNRELAKYCAGKSASACAEMRGWLADKSRGDDLL